MAQDRPRIFLPNVVELDSGLLVPAPGQHDIRSRLAALPTSIPDKSLLVVGAPPSDVDAWFVTPDPEVLGFEAPSLEAICDTLRSVPVEPAMFGLAGIAASVWHAGTDQVKHLRVAEEIFVGRPVLDLFRAFVKESPQHMLFNEQHLTILMRLLLIHGAEGDAKVDMTDEQVDALITAMLGVSGLTADPEIKGEEPTDWVPWMVRSGLYFDRSNLGSDQGRARALFVDLAGDADPDGDHWCDLDAWLSEDLVPLAQQFGYAYAMGGFSKALLEDVPTIERFIGVVTDGLLAGNLAADEVERLVVASSATRQDYVAMFKDNDDHDHLLWDRTPFERRPFFRVGDGRLLVLSPRFLHSWMGEGVYYRLLDAAMRRPDPRRTARRATLRFTQFHGELVERYVQRLSERSHEDQSQAGIVEITPERTYIGKRGTEQKSPDLILTYATDIVAVEVTGGRPSRRTRVISDPSLLKKELDDRVIGKLDELDAALVDVLDGTVEIPGVRLDLVERVWPLLIVPATIIQSDFLWAHIERHSAELFTRHSAVQHPTLFSIEDFEQALAAVENGASLPQILGTRLASAYRRMPPSHFFWQHFRAERRPTYLDEQLRLVAEEAKTALSLSGNA